MLGMDLTDTEEEAAFRAEARAFLAANTPREPLPSVPPGCPQCGQRWLASFFLDKRVSKPPNPPLQQTAATLRFCGVQRPSSGPCC